MSSKERKVDRDSLIEIHQEYVQEVARRLIHSLRIPAAQFDEICASGYLGLVEAAERYHGDSADGFVKFAYLRIRGAMIDGIRRSSALSRQGYRYARALRAVHELQDSQDHEAIKEISARERIANALQLAAEGALAFQVLESGLVESISDEDVGTNESVEDKISKKEFSVKIRKIVETLPDNERKIVEGYYFEDKQFVEIVEENEEFSKSWVSRLHKRALARMARALQECPAE